MKKTKEKRGKAKGDEMQKKSKEKDREKLGENKRKKRSPESEGWKRTNESARRIWYRVLRAESCEEFLLSLSTIKIFAKNRYFIISKLLQKLIYK